VVEVVWTSGGLDKLEIYRRIGVPEVWFWIQGTISVHRLVDDAYTKVETSALVPGLDLKLLARLLAMPAKDGMRELRAAVAASRG
jgi:Uma2 family endonuclease